MTGTRGRKRKQTLSSLGEGRAPAGANPGFTCVWFGADRLPKVRAAAESAGLSLSAYVCEGADLLLHLTPTNLRKLATLARESGLEVPELVARLVAQALKA